MARWTRPKEILPKKQGFNRFHWDLRRESLPSVEKVLFTVVIQEVEYHLEITKQTKSK